MSNEHTNAFINLNGVPYVLAEYVDQDSFQTIDRAMIKSDISIDNTDPMRAILDIAISSIDTDSSGNLNIIGNATKQASLIEMIKNNIYQLDHHLPVLKRGLIVRVNYQLENNRTGKVMRSFVEDVRIMDRNYFIAINKDITDSAIIVNFTDSAVSSINQFTHGTDLMQFRITSIQLAYECVRPKRMRPRIGEPLYRTPPEIFAADGLNDEHEMYYYHKSLQSRYHMGEPWPNEHIIPRQWYDFNRYYHFNTSGKDLILHEQEIEDESNRIMHIACGTVMVNRTFLVQTGQRIVFKFSIWKNDLTMVNDASKVAEALRVNTTPYYPPIPDKPDEEEEESTTPVYPPYPPYPYPPMPFEFRYIIDLLERSKGMDYRQNSAINKLNSSLAEIAKIIKEYHEGAETPEIPESDLPESDKPHPPAPPHKPPKGILVILEMIKDLQERISEIEESDHGAKPISEEEIQRVLDALESDWEDNHEYDGSSEYPKDIGDNIQLNDLL